MGAVRQSLSSAFLIALTSMPLSFQAGAVQCATSDVSLTIGGTLYSPTACADRLNQRGGPTAETDSLNSGLGTSGYVYLDKSDDPGTPTGVSGVDFQVTASGGNTGTWALSWIDDAGLPDLPLTVDLEVGLFGGNNGSGYLFQDMLLPVGLTAGTGTYDINFANHGGQQPGLSHLLIAGADASPVTPPIPVPEPSSFALLGGALFSLGWASRRRRV